MNVIKTLGNLLLVEDDDLLSELSEKYLASHGYTVTIASCGEKISGILNDQVIDLIVLDILLPGNDGLYWLSWLQENHPTIPVIICSVKTTAEERALGLDAGAVDYIVKPFHPRELFIRIRNLLSNHQQRNPREQKADEYCFDSRLKQLYHNGRILKLTSQEKILLAYFFEHEGKTVSREEISDALYGGSHNPTNRKIDMQITRLRKKLEGNSSAPSYLQTVWGQGYRLTFPK